MYDLETSFVEALVMTTKRKRSDKENEIEQEVLVANKDTNVLAKQNTAFAPVQKTTCEPGQRSRCNKH